MACLSDSTILAYGEGALGAIEAAQARDHLLLCQACQLKAERYRRLEGVLQQPVISEPPARLVPQVLQRLYPALPRYSSIAAMIAASAVFLVSWIYIYFDFASSSMVQALRLMASGTSGWLADVIKGITTVYNGAQAMMKAASALLRIFLPAPLGTDLAAIAFLAVAGLLAVHFLRPWLKKARAKRT
jgi:hypothetical protein